MRKIATLISASLLVIACGLEETRVGDHSNPDGIWTGPPQNQYGQVSYVTVVDYPDGYDWRSDPGGTEAACSLAVFADGVPVLRVPVGESHQTSADPQRHRVIGGHLYTDWTDGTVTVIKKDGRELFRYEAPETVARMLVQEGVVHTLNISTGGGFVYRVDGKEVLRRDDAILFGHLDICEGRVCFCFSRSVKEASGVVERYYSVCDGTVEMLELNGLVHDVRHYDDGLYALVSKSEGLMPMLVRGSMEERPGIFLSGEVTNAEFLGRGCLCVSVRCILYPDSSLVTALWYGGDMWRRSPKGVTAVAACASRNGMCMLCNPRGTEAGVICVDTETYEMPAGYSIRGYNPVAYGENGAVAGLSSDSGGPPAIWMNGNVNVLNINGYISGVSLSDDVSR